MMALQRCSCTRISQSSLNSSITMSLSPRCGSEKVGETARFSSIHHKVQGMLTYRPWLRGRLKTLENIVSVADQSVKQRRASWPSIAPDGFDCNLSGAGLIGIVERLPMVTWRSAVAGLRLGAVRKLFFPCDGGGGDGMEVWEAAPAARVWLAWASYATMGFGSIVGLAQILGPV